jgi:hypothetical protein
MMIDKNETFEKLAHLHDSTVQELSFRSSERGERSVIIRVQAHYNCGLDEFSGRSVHVVIHDALFVLATLLGHTLSSDTINICQPRISPESEKRLAQFRHQGIDVPPVRLGIAFNSGSEIEIACRRVVIELQPR